MTDATMTRQQLVTLIKEYRDQGYILEVKLNTTTEALRKEYDRLQSAWKVDNVDTEEVVSAEPAEAAQTQYGAVSGIEVCKTESAPAEIAEFDVIETVLPVIPQALKEQGFEARVHIDWAENRIELTSDHIDNELEQSYDAEAQELISELEYAGVAVASITKVFNNCATDSDKANAREWIRYNAPWTSEVKPVDTEETYTDELVATAPSDINNPAFIGVTIVLLAVVAWHLIFTFMLALAFTFERIKTTAINHNLMHKGFSAAAATAKLTLTSVNQFTKVIASQITLW